MQVLTTTTVAVVAHHRASLRIATVPIRSRGIVTRDDVSLDVSAAASVKVVDPAENRLHTTGAVPVATLPTLIGLGRTRHDAEQLARRHGWQIRADGLAWRRVVPSPDLARTSNRQVATP